MLGLPARQTLSHPSPAATAAVAAAPPSGLGSPVSLFANFLTCPPTCLPSIAPRGSPQAQLCPRRGVCGPRGPGFGRGRGGRGGRAPGVEPAGGRGARGRVRGGSAAPASRRCPRAGRLPRLTSLKLWDFLLLFLSENSMVRARWRRGRRPRRRLRRARVTAAEPPGPRSASRSAGGRPSEGREEPPRAPAGGCGRGLPGRSCPLARRRLPRVLGAPSVPPHAASLFPERRPPQPNFPRGAGPGGGAELRGARRGPPGLSLRTRPGGRGEPREGGGGGGCGAAAGALTAPAGGGAAPAEGAAPPGPRGHLLAEPGRRHPPGAAAAAGLGRTAPQRGTEAAAQRPWRPGPTELPPGRTLRSAGPPSAAPGGELAFRNKPGIQGSRLLRGQPSLCLESRAVPGPDTDFRQLLVGGEELTHPRSASKREEI